MIAIVEVHLFLSIIILEGSTQRMNEWTIEGLLSLLSLIDLLSTMDTEETTGEKLILEDHRITMIEDLKKED